MDFDYTNLIEEETLLDDIKNLYLEENENTPKTLIKLLDIVDTKILPRELLSELNESLKSTSQDESSILEKYIANKILVKQQDKFFPDKPFPDAYTRLAQISLTIGNIDETIQLYEQVLTFSHDPLLRNIANNALKKGLVDEAQIIKCIKNFDDAITTAVSFRRTRKMRKSFVIKIIDIAYKLAENQFQFVKVAAEYKKLGELQKSKMILQNIKNYNGDTPTNAALVYAATLRKEKSYAESKALYEILLSENPNHTYILTGYAALLKDMQYYTEAYNVCQKVLNINPTSTHILKVLASLLAKTDNIELAKNIFEKMERFYKYFNPYKYLDDRIKEYMAYHNYEGANRIRTIRKSLEKMYHD